MKIFYNIFILSLLMPFSVTQGYTSPLSPQPGTGGNPIYINGTVELVTTNEQKEDDLIQKYGYSEYQSCRASYCGVTGGNPSLESQCLAQVETMFHSGICGRSTPSVQCDTGYTLINGSCVRTVETTPASCPSGTRPIGSACVAFTCSQGYTPQGSSCVPVQAEVVTEVSPEEGNLYQDLSTQINELTQQIDSFTAGNATPDNTAPSTVREVAPKETNICTERFGKNGVVVSVNENNTPTCGCAEGYAIGSDGLCSEVVTNTQGEAVTTSNARTAKESEDGASPVTYAFAIAMFGIVANGLRLYFKANTL